MATREGIKTEAAPGSILLVVHDFVARSADELSLAKGDRIELIERDDDFGDGWYLGRHMNNGNTGLFPEVYTTPAPKGTLSNAAVNGARRATENLSRPTTSTESSAAQQRQSSAPTQLRPTSATSPKNSSPLAQTTPTIRTSLPNDTHSYSMMNMQSPVMNETLSVINEHIVDMNSPRTSYANGSSRGRHNSMSSAYSSQPPNRMSYIAGHETDEEGHELHTEEEVSAWTPLRVAEYLEDQGVERQHCDVFREQEISGDVLLAMEQSSVFMKEFDLGPVGRRLRTWHKIKALQDEVRRSSPDIPRSTSDYSTGGATEDASDAGDHDAGRTRSTSAASALPRGLSTRQSVEGRSSTMQSYQQQQQPQSGTFTRSSQAMSPLQSMTSFSRPENTYRPSAQSIRSMNHTRRHSSIGSIDSTAGSSRVGHKKQASIDNKWQPGQPIINGSPSNHGHNRSSDTTRPSHYRQSSLNAPIPASPGEMDKGYFSSTEVENRHKPTKNVLQKKSVSGVASSNHSRNSSLVTQQRISSQPSQPPSVSSSQEQVTAGAAAPPERLSDATTAVSSKFGSFRTSSMPQFKNKPMLSSKDDPGTPIVTKLEYNTTPTSLDAIASSPTGTTATGGSDGSGPVRSPMSASLPFFITKSKVKGLRATSDAVTTTEKSAAGSSLDRVPSTVKEGEVSSPTRTGSTTPSTETRSFDMKPVRSSTGSGNNLMPPPSTTRRPQRKTKKETSAYTRGLQKQTPAEAMAGADYSGWMKKKSGSLMTTWKPRLFVLKGRRLSYYYSENDTEEKGLIDISFHNVMVAHNEKLTGLHAAMTGAAGASPTSPNSTATFTSAQKDLAENPPKPDTGDEGLFIFKLTPPKSGRGVTFTKPTVHYFAVNSRQEGRLWMAALMKAVIDRDQDGVVTTTYNQKTISLAKARARKERPPALKEEGDAIAGAERSELDAGDDVGSAASLAGSKSGLGIGGLSSDPEAIADRALEEKVPSLEDGGSSVAPSSIMGGSVIAGTDLESPALNEKEREAVALNMPG